ncbi:MAG: hypothetical protein K2Q17_13560 [Nitrospiraceae bacterium]|jgi:hypothetical protein|uniref:hypothetical protein n=1 Tax=Nitrospira cf. moscoviensis SBR1015 TaxID=96242 RepID=UPI000A0CC10A|nr:hypothetical protein [Nitrospira cf. moscoviensis SBR1015]MBY0248685.1 hypothetical protein [Nitrospiraceae bacterium]OQW35999.1 MAG: hypothetical protein A4E20_08600 [Nitrospira sp. SG-bin2]
MTAIMVTEEGTAMTEGSWLRLPIMSAKKIGGRIEGPTGNKTAVKIGKLIGARIGRWIVRTIADPTPAVNCVD